MKLKFREWLEKRGGIVKEHRLFEDYFTDLENAMIDYLDEAVEELNG